MVCLPLGDIGGLPSVPSVVRSPVVKNTTPAYEWSSFESKIRPSLVARTLNPCLFPRSVTVSSTRLGFPPTLFTTSCSQPDDFVNTSTDLFDGPISPFESARPAPVSVAARRNSRRLVNSFIPAPSQPCPVHILNSEQSHTRRPFSHPILSLPVPASHTPR